MRITTNDYLLMGLALLVISVVIFVILEQMN